MTLYLVCDTSGSMLADGKHLIIRGAVRATEQFMRLGYGCADLKLVAWSKDAQLIEWSPDFEFPGDALPWEPASNVEALVALFGAKPDGKILLFSDGFWLSDEDKKLRRWNESLPPDALRVVLIGADANWHLKSADVFATEDLFVALDGWLDRGRHDSLEKFRGERRRAEP